MIPGTWLARYYKVFVPGWFSYHWKVQLAGTLIAITGIIVALTGNKNICSLKSYRWLTAHRYSLPLDFRALCAGNGSRHLFIAPMHPWLFE
jgi:hypothetical protein